MYVQDNARLISAGNIEIKDVLGTSIALPLNQLGNLGENNKFKGNNGYDAIEVLGSEINLPSELVWKGFQDGTTYWISGNLLVKSGLVIQPGVHIEFATEKYMEVSGEAYVTALGTASNPITFTGKSKTKGYWKGSVFHHPVPKTNLITS
jgi:RNAse (barnase) inhibitor barstar